MTHKFGLGLHQVLVDATNVFTYIDSFDARSQLAQRGHGKEGRKFLRLVGVALPPAAAALHLSRQPPRRTPVPEPRRRDRASHAGLRQGQHSRQHLCALRRQMRRRRDSKIRGGRKPGVAGTQEKVDGWLRARHMRDPFSVKVRQENGLPKVTYRFQRRAWEKLERTLLGETLTFADNSGWSDAALVRGYRAQHHLQSAFRQVKDTDCIAIRPQHHRTDQKIQVHVFCCVLALTLCSLLQRELSRHGVQRLIPALLAELGGIREVHVLYLPWMEGGTPELWTTLSQLTAEQRSMYDILGLDSYAI